jgi:hypothetical protein
MSKAAILIPLAGLLIFSYLFATTGEWGYLTFPAAIILSFLAVRYQAHRKSAHPHS